MPATPVETRPTTWQLLVGGGRPLLALLVVALIVKLIVAAAAISGDPLTAYATSDARYYIDRALGMLGRLDDPFATEPYHLPPLYPWVLRLTPGFGEGAYGGVMILQALAGTAMLAGVYVLARRRMGQAAALLAAALTLLYGPLTFYETRLLGDSLATNLLIAVLVAADVLADRPSAARASILGLLVAAVSLLRPQALLLAVALAVWIGMTQRRYALAYVVGLLALLSPFTLHNVRASGDLIPVSDNGGVNLWLANTGPLSGTFTTHDERFGDIDRQAAVARQIAQDQAGRPLSPGEVSSWLSQEALTVIFARPGEFMQRVGLRARALLETFETDVVAIPPVETTTIPPLRVLALPFGLLAGLALGAALLGARFASAPRAPMWCVAGMVVLTALVFFHYSRFRLPLVPLLALCTAAGVERARAGAVHAGRWVAAIVGCVVVVLVSMQPAPHHAGTLANGWTSLAQARLAQATPGDTAAVEAALADARRALEHKPGFARADLLGARATLLLGRFDACDGHLLSLEALVPGYPPVMLQRALLAAHPGPGNRHRDPDLARQLVSTLRLPATTDPELQAGIDQVERMLSL
jgi:hypothetical protein